MDEQQVEAVGLQLAQGVLGRGHDVVTAGVVVVDAVARSVARHELDATLGHQLQPVAQPRLGGQRRAEQPFAGVAAVDVGVVERGDAQVEAAVDEAQQRAGVHAPLTQPPHAGHQARELRAASGQLNA